MTKIPIIMCWSGGKDSALALAELLDSPDYEVRGLLTTVTEGYDRISMHGVRRELLEAQADAIGLKLTQVTIPPQCINDIYQQRMEAACRAFQKQGINHMAFGDLFLEDIRAYRDKTLGSIGMTAVYPVWGLNTAHLAQDFIERGFKAILCCIDPKQIAPDFCGRDYDEYLLADLPASADPCGEKGEFHTFVYDGPIFQYPVACIKGEAVLRDNFWFNDMLTHEESRMNKERLVTLSLMILAAAASRLLPHPYNFTPVAAIALFSGVTFERKLLAFIVPILALLLSDAVLGFYGFKEMLVTYSGFAAVVCIGGGFMVSSQRLLPVALGTLSGAVVFFLITNFALFYPSYPHTLQGIMQSYIAGLPFFRNTLLSDILYSVLLFGSFLMAERKYEWLRVRQFA